MKKILVFLVIIFSGCLSFKPDSEYLTGEWTDFIPKQGVQYFAGEEHKFTFKIDSFYYHAERWSDVQRENDTCSFYDDNRYAAGKYMVKEDVLYLSGEWTGYNYSNLKMHPCEDTGKFELVYSIDVIKENVMEMRLKNPLPYFYDWRYRDILTLYRQK